MLRPHGEGFCSWRPCAWLSCLPEGPSGNEPSVIRCQPTPQAGQSANVAPLALEAGGPAEGPQQCPVRTSVSSLHQLFGPQDLLWNPGQGAGSARCPEAKVGSQSGLPYPVLVGSQTDPSI